MHRLHFRYASFESLSVEGHPSRLQFLYQLHWLPARKLLPARAMTINHNPAMSHLKALREFSTGFWNAVPTYLPLRVLYRPLKYSLCNIVLSSCCDVHR